MISFQYLVVVTLRYGISFPKQIALDKGEPITCTSVDSDRDGLDELAVVFHHEDGMRLLVIKPLDRNQDEGAWEVLSETPLDSINRNPTGIAVIDIFDNNSSGLIIFVPREAPVILCSGEGELTHLRNLM